jgi:hypothetical protein
LVVTISLMILLALLGVGMLSLSTVSLRSSSQATARAEARANARLSLIIALGELQQAMGPDRRISARAGTLAQHPQLDAKVPANTPRFWWVGAATSDPEKGFHADRPAGADNPGVKWLVSGLDSSLGAAQQISAAMPFEESVAMYGNQSIDTATFTGGKPVEAGILQIADARGRGAGGFAWFVDDDGMKAQLVASDPGARNDVKPPAGDGVLPGSYDLGVLDRMEGFEGVPLEDYSKLLSLNDLPLIGGDGNIVRAKRLGYTTLSRGVLSDVRKGGLKRDLTIAFERDNVFDAVFPKGRGGAFASSYVVMDAGKFNQCDDLKGNGYIHWDMFKDYYNIKRAIRSTGSGRTGGDSLDISLITKDGIFNGYDGTAFGRGQLGPHKIGNNGDVPAQQRQLPYGEIACINPPANQSSKYVHNPLFPVLSRMQQNAWCELMPPASRGQNQRIRTRVQLWKSQYNPYNIQLNVIGDGSAFGPRIIHYPQVYFTLTGVSYKETNGSVRPFENVPGFSGKRQTSVPYNVMLGPGRAHVFAFRSDGGIGSDNDDLNYDDRVRDLTLESVYSDRELASSLRGNLGMTVDFILERPSMMHGSNSNAYNASHEVSQTMWAPFAYEAIRNLPGKQIKKSDISPSELNENTMASFAFKLRSTREGSGALRPLIDSNIRAMLWNTRWDSPLGVDCLAAYSPANQGEVEDQVPQMNTSDAPKGYTYWGAGDDPFDGFDRVILFDIPRRDLVSLGQLQHAGIGRFSYEPSYITGNSYANLRIPLDDWRASVADSFSTRGRGLANAAIPGNFNLYDASYLVNEELWDSYIFTTIPQVKDNQSGTDIDPTDRWFDAALAGEERLPNPRFLPYEPAGSSFDRATLQMTSGSRGTTGGFYHNAGHLLVDGAFNVNSTSVDAWEAFLSGTHGLPYQKLTTGGKVADFATDADGVRFPRVQSVLGGPTDTDRLDENYWIGFRNLEKDEVRELAGEIVEEIKKRGPFLTLGEFVNRKLDDGEPGQRGALQAALDATVNKDLDSAFEDDAGAGGIPDDSTQGAGFPGQLLQGDVLQALSPYMTVRSDSFTIRAYGDSREASTGRIVARAWCEAKVQRYPDPVASDDASGNALAELVDPSSPFGRGFRILSFRWLSPNEI